MVPERGAEKDDRKGCRADVSPGKDAQRSSILTNSRPDHASFPDMDYFSDPSVRKVLTTILFLWAIEHGDVGYRQVRLVDGLLSYASAQQSRLVMIGHA